MKALNLVGKVFGKLTALSRVEGVRPARWHCQCSCGNSTEVSVCNLTKKVGSTKSCGCLALSPNKIEVGKAYATQSSGDVLVLARQQGDYVEIRFDDGTVTTVTQGNLRKGNVRNPNLRVTYGVGYHGIGPFAQHNVKAHEYWSKMMQRAYCPEYKAEHPTYKDVTVAAEWHSYQVFAEWCTQQKNYGLFGMNLDKDIIVRGNKTYGPEFCCLIPQQVNKLLRKNFLKRDLPLGVVKENNRYVARCRVDKVETYLGIFLTPEEAGNAYVVAKEREIKRVAEFYKDQIDARVYDALMAYTVEEDDQATTA